MNSFNLKFLITLLGGVVFSLIFILLALIIPVKNSKDNLLIIEKPETKLTQISQSTQER